MFLKTYHIFNIGCFVCFYVCQKQHLRLGLDHILIIGVVLMLLTYFFV